jgi:hypothetical protein
MDRYRLAELKRSCGVCRPTEMSCAGSPDSVLAWALCGWPDAVEARTRCTRKRRKKCRRAGKQCLSNGSCAIVCTTNQDCPSSDCNGCSNPDVDGAHHCIVGQLVPLVTCTSTAKCPRGSHCQDSGGGGVCIALCQ